MGGKTYIMASQCAQNVLNIHDPNDGNAIASYDVFTQARDADNVKVNQALCCFAQCPDEACWSACPSALPDNRLFVAVGDQPLQLSPAAVQPSESEPTAVQPSESEPTAVQPSES